MPGLLTTTGEMTTMTTFSKGIFRHVVQTVLFSGLCMAFASIASAQSGAQAKATSAAGIAHDPAEPPKGKAEPKSVPRPAGRVARQSVDEKSMRVLIHELVGCGTRSTLSAWDDPARGAGCGRDRIVARLNEIAKDSGGKLQVVVDKFESTSARKGEKPVALENVYALLPGSDEKLAKTIFIVSGHFDSRPSDVMDPKADAPGAVAEQSRRKGAWDVSCHDIVRGGFRRGTGVARQLASGGLGEATGLHGGRDVYGRYCWRGHRARRASSSARIFRQRRD